MVDLGVLVTEGRWERLKNGMPQAWWSQEARHGVRRVFACAAHLDENGGGAEVLRAGPDGAEVGRISALPTIWLNDLAAPTAREAGVLRSLNGQPDYIVFNESNRFRREMLHAMLAAAPLLRDVLAPIGEQSYGPGLYLLAPRRRSARLGLWLNAREPGVVARFRPSTGERGEQPGSLRDLLPFLSPSATLLWLPGWPEGGVEWRFYLHREDAGDWTVAGEVAKLDFLRESGRRERCWPLAEKAKELFGAAAAHYVSRMRATALSVVQTLARFQPGLVHCAVDFWALGENQICLADIAGRYRLDWLARSGQGEALAHISEFPLRFAATLARTGVEKLHVDYGRAGKYGGTGVAAAGAPLPGHRADPDPPSLRRRKRHGDCDEPCPPCPPRPDCE